MTHSFIFLLHFSCNFSISLCYISYLLKFFFFFNSCFKIILFRDLMLYFEIIKPSFMSHQCRKSFFDHKYIEWLLCFVFSWGMVTLSFGNGNPIYSWGNTREQYGLFIYFRLFLLFFRNKRGIIWPVTKHNTFITSHRDILSCNYH